MPGNTTVAEVDRRLAAPPARVFGAFADAARVARWLTPAPEVRLRVLRFEFRVGGGYRFAYDVPGRPTMHVNGEFRAIDPPARLVFDWNIEPPDEHAGVRSTVTVSVRADGGGTRLRIRHERLTAPGAARRHAEGWRGALAQLAGLVETGAVPAREQGVEP